MSKMIDISLQIASDELLRGWGWGRRLYSYRNKPTKCKRCWFVHCGMHLLSYSQYMFSLLRLDAVLKRQSVLSNRRGGTGGKKNGCLLWNPQCLNHAKTLESRGERLGGVMWCWARTWRQIKVDVFGPSGARSSGCLWERMGKLHGHAETVRVFSVRQ